MIIIYRGRLVVAPRRLTLDDARFIGLVMGEAKI